MPAWRGASARKARRPGPAASRFGDAMRGRQAGGRPRVTRQRPAGREALLRPAMRGGRCLSDNPDLAAARNHANDQLVRLPEPLARLEPYTYPAEISASLRELTAELDHRAGTDGTPA